MVFNYDTFPVLKTQRLTLRKLTLGDANTIFALRSSEEINKFVATKRMQSIEEAKDFIQICNALYLKEDRIFWAITKQEEIIGTIVLHRISLDTKYAEIGYKLKPEMQQRGFMSEAIFIGKDVLRGNLKRFPIGKSLDFYDYNNLY